MDKKLCNHIVTYSVLPQNYANIICTLFCNEHALLIPTFIVAGTNN